MSLCRWGLLAMLALSLAGCGRRITHPPSEPLTVEAWTALPPETKFEIATLERLKQGTPQLQDDREWDRFARTVLNPARKKELPAGAPGKT